MDEINTLAAELGDRLKQQGFVLATAESCTGGWIAQAITSVPGSSVWFDCGFVTYSDASKQRMLAVDGALIKKHGAVSEPVVKAMAEGALLHSQANISVAVTGIAGPEGGTTEKPVGTVWLGLAKAGGTTETLCQHFVGDRQSVRAQTVLSALQRVFSFVVSS